MGEYVATGLTGEGHVPFASTSKDVLSVWINVTTWTPKARQIGTMHPYGLWHIGQVGLGSFSDDAYASDPPWTMWETFITNENKNYTVKRFTDPSLFSVSVWWRLNPGVTITLAVEW